MDRNPGMSVPASWPASGQTVPDGNSGDLTAAGDTQLAQDVARVFADGAWTEIELRGNLRIGQSPAKEGQDLALAACQAKLVGTNVGGRCAGGGGCVPRP